MDLHTLYVISESSMRHLQDFGPLNPHTLPGKHDFLPILQILIGIALLTFGRRLFWLFVGTMGFMFGLCAAPLAFPTENTLVLYLIALISGIIGVILALFLQHVIIAAAGFLAAGYLTVTVLERLSLHMDRFSWLIFLAGGILGAIFILAVFDWALIALTSLTGAAFITDLVQIHPRLVPVLFGALTIIGIVVQAIINRASRPTGAGGAPGE
ncbi:MAG: hypothetical protein ACP5G0_04170 [Desulfomonilia bacterium]